MSVEGSGLRGLLGRFLIEIERSVEIVALVRPDDIILLGYRFSDLLRIGAPLNILLSAVAVVLIPRIWPF